MLRRSLILSASLLCSAAANAQNQTGAVVGLTVGDVLAPTTVNGTGSFEYDNTLAVDGGSAFGYANLTSGILRGTTVSAVNSSTAVNEAQSISGFGDFVTFNAGATGTASLAVHWDGTLSPYLGSNYALATLAIAVTYDGNSNPIGYQYGLSNDPNFHCSTGATCISGTSINQIASFSFAIQPGPTYISVGLLLYSIGGQTTDFSNTANFYLSVPSGVTYTSASGEFLATAAPIAQVPEPTAYAMMLGGLVLLGCIAIRRAGAHSR